MILEERFRKLGGISNCSRRHADAHRSSSLRSHIRHFGGPGLALAAGIAWTMISAPHIQAQTMVTVRFQAQLVGVEDPSALLPAAFGQPSAQMITGVLWFPKPQGGSGERLIKASRLSWGSGISISLGSYNFTAANDGPDGAVQLIDGGTSAEGDLPDTFVFRSRRNEKVGGFEVREIGLQFDIPDGRLLSKTSQQIRFPALGQLTSDFGLTIEGTRPGDRDVEPFLLRFQLTAISWE
jgi:hypothetical protein